MDNKKTNDFIKVIKFIYNQMDNPLTLELIAKNVGMSCSNLKRLFVEVTGRSAGSFIRCLKMEQAFRSLKDKDLSVLETALSSGFEDHSAFARAFKEYFGYSPTSARSKINIINELECVTLNDPSIVAIKTFKLQAITKQGLYFEAAPCAWEALEKHLTDEELSDDFLGTFIGIGHDNPHDKGVREDNVRFSAGVTHAHHLNINEITIEEGTYAKFDYTGKLNNLGLAYHYIYGAWNTKSNIKINNTKHAFIAFDAFPHELEHKLAIYVPLNYNEVS